MTPPLIVAEQEYRELTREPEASLLIEDGDAQHSRQVTLRTLMLFELKRKFSASECAFLVQVASGLTRTPDYVTRFRRIACERALAHGEDWAIEPEPFCAKINSLTPIEIYALANAVDRFLDRSQAAPLHLASSKAASAILPRTSSASLGFRAA